MSDRRTAEERLLDAIFGVTPEEQAERDEREAVAASRLRALRTRKALQLAPELAEHIQDQVLHTDGRTERGIEMPEAKTPLHTGKADDADELYARLIEWVTYWSRWLEFVPSATSVVARRVVDPGSPARDPQVTAIGFRAGTTPGGARALVQLQTMWLLSREAAFTQIDPGAAEAYQDDVTGLVWGLRAKYGLTPVRERLVSARPCPLCGVMGVHATWLSAQLADVEIVCEVCGHEIAAPRLSQIQGWLS